LRTGRRGVAWNTERTKARAVGLEKGVLEGEFRNEAGVLLEKEKKNAKRASAIDGNGGEGRGKLT